jgi:hypothetical protein
MRRLLFCALVLLLIGAPAQAGAASGTWVTVVSDGFRIAGPPPAHWKLYSGRYSGANCASPRQDFVRGGYLHLLMSYRTTGSCGAGWYTGGMMLGSRYEGIDQRITLRWRIVYHGVRAHYVIPMRWPSDDADWPAGGEEDFCEGSALTGCTTFLHYSPSNQQVSHDMSFDLTKWHTWRFSRFDHKVRVYVDGLLVWSYTGSEATLPSTLKRVVLQQQCRDAGCPAGQTGSEDIQVDWIQVDRHV